MCDIKGCYRDPDYIYKEYAGKKKEGRICTKCLYDLIRIGPFTKMDFNYIFKGDDMPENLMNKDHKTTNESYRDGYDRIWGPKPKIMVTPNGKVKKIGGKDGREKRNPKNS